jgi:murein hydrolase activator
MILMTVLLVLGQVEKERDNVKERLEEERAAFERLKTEKESLSELLQSLEQLSRASAHAAKALEQRARRDDLVRAEAECTLKKLDNQLVQSQRVLAPKLLSLYRLKRQRNVLSAFETQSLASFLRQQRVYGRLVEADMAALRRQHSLARYARIRQTRLERVAESAQAYETALKQEQAIGQARLLRFQELLAETKAEANLKSRSIADLALSERELAEFLAEDFNTETHTGFRALKGKLPAPVRGLIEVGFGKVINPKFNTVTVQKGLDLRAPLGTDVVAVAAGTVVFSGWLKGYGNVLIVDHGDEYHTVYTHLANSVVELGQAVAASQRIGQVGDTGSLKGPFLYFEVRRKGVAVDPQLWLVSDE